MKRVPCSGPKKDSKQMLQGRLMVDPFVCLLICMNTHTHACTNNNKIKQNLTHREVLYQHVYIKRHTLVKFKQQLIGADEFTVDTLTRHCCQRIKYNVVETNLSITKFSPFVACGENTFNWFKSEFQIVRSTINVFVCVYGFLNAVDECFKTI